WPAPEPSATASASGCTSSTTGVPTPASLSSNAWPPPSNAGGQPSKRSSRPGSPTLKAKESTELSSSPPATPTASATPPTSAYEHASQPPAEPADASSPLNLEEPLFGKYLNGYPNGAPSSTYIPPGWTRWFSPNGGSPYSEYNYDVNDNGTTTHYGSAPSDYGVDVISDKLTTFIKNTTTNYPNKPFFTYLAPYIPHRPATPPPRYDGTYAAAKAPRPPAFNEHDVSDKPAWIKNKARLTQAQIDNIDALYEKRRESLQSVTDLVQNTIDTLQAQGVLDNTYIVFTS